MESLQKRGTLKEVHRLDLTFKNLENESIIKLEMQISINDRFFFDRVASDQSR